MLIGCWFLFDVSLDFIILMTMLLWRRRNIFFNKCVFETIFLSYSSWNGFQIDMMMLPCNLHTRNDWRKFTAVNSHNVSEKSYKTFYHVVSFEVCQSYVIIPIGFNIEKTPCVAKLSKNFSFWEKGFTAAQSKFILSKHYLKI